MRHFFKRNWGTRPDVDHFLVLWTGRLPRGTRRHGTFFNFLVVTRDTFSCPFNAFATFSLTEMGKERNRKMASRFRAFFRFMFPLLSVPKSRSVLGSRSFRFANCNSFRVPAPFVHGTDYNFPFPTLTFLNEPIYFVPVSCIPPKNITCVPDPSDSAENNFRSLSRGFHWINKLRSRSNRFHRKKCVPVPFGSAEKK